MGGKHIRLFQRLVDSKPLFNKSKYMQLLLICKHWKGIKIWRFVITARAFSSTATIIVCAAAAAGAGGGGGGGV